MMVLIPLSLSWNLSVIGSIRRVRRVDKFLFIVVLEFRGVLLSP